MPAGKGNASAIPILFYDARCLLCQRSIRWIIRRDPEGVFSFAGLDSAAAERHVPPEHPLRSADTVILCDEDGLHGHSSAAFRSLRRLRTAWRGLLIFSILPRSLTDWTYRQIAKRRYGWFGTDESCALPEPGETERFLD